jgi:hypothetical protein
MISLEVSAMGRFLSRAETSRGDEVMETIHPARVEHQVPRWRIVATFATMAVVILALIGAIWATSNGVLFPLSGPSINVRMSAAAQSIEGCSVLANGATEGYLWLQVVASPNIFTDAPATVTYRSQNYSLYNPFGTTSESIHMQSGGYWTTVRCERGASHRQVFSAIQSTLSSGGRIDFNGPD